MKKNSKIYIAGHRGLVGSAIVRALQSQNYTSLILRTRDELNLLDSQKVADFFQSEKPEYVFMAAAKVGGIMANKTKKADFIYENLQVQNNIIYQSHRHNVKKLIFLGSSCIYPKLSPQPIQEEYLLTGPLEETNDAYAIAKIAGIKMCQSFNEQYQTKYISVMPTNLYGPHDNYDLNNSHVLPAMIRKFHDAKLANHSDVTLWGDGNPRREFMYVDDMANACIHLMLHYESSQIINIGTGEDIAIRDVAEIVQKVVGHKGRVIWDTTKPNGTPRKLLDVSKLHKTGWKYSTSLIDGIQLAYKAFLNEYHG
jgi:GDP-L-fucose synthase